MMKKILAISLMLAVFSLQLNSKGQGNRHLVKKGETLYSLAKKYHVTVSELAKANKISTRTEIKIGQQLVIPGLLPTKAVAKVYKPVAVPSTPDTPYREEDPRPRQVKATNTQMEASSDPNRLIVEKPKEAEPAAKPIVATSGLKTTSSNAVEYPEIFKQYSINGYLMKKDKGIANYLADATSGNQNLAFYSGAETGSVIRVTNMMNHKTIFVKVIGKVPPVDVNNEIVLKLSNKAAQDLEVTEEKFLVEVASFSEE